MHADSATVCWISPCLGSQPSTLGSRFCTCSYIQCPEVTCIGIELSRKRHTMALGALQRLRQVAEKGSGGSARAAASAAARVAFYCVDMRGCFGEGAANSATDCVAGGVTGSATDNGTDGTLRDVTVVYLMNQDLPSKLVDDVVEALLALARERRGAASSAPPGANPSEERSGDRAADGVLASAASVASAASAASAALVALAPAASLAASPPPPEAGASSGVNCNARGAPARPRRLTLVTLLRLRGFADLRVQRTIDSRQVGRALGWVTTNQEAWTGGTTASVTSLVRLHRGNLLAWWVLSLRSHRRGWGTSPCRCSSTSSATTCSATATLRRVRRVRRSRRSSRSLKARAMQRL